MGTSASAASTFRTAVVRIPGGPGSIEIIDVPVVEPGPGEVRVGIAAAPVNPVDLAVAGGVFHQMGLISQPEHTGLGCGWRVTGLARAEDQEFVRGLGAGFTTRAEPGWDAVADGAVLQERGLALVRDGGAFVGVQPSAQPAEERGISVSAVTTRPDGPRLAGLLARTASGELHARVHAVVSLDQVADAHRAVAKGGVRGRYVLRP